MTKRTLGLVAAALIAPMGANAATVDGTFDVTTAISERRGLGHSLWFELSLGLGLDLNYVMITPGSFVADALGAMMTGSVGNRADATAGFDFSFVYDRDFSDNTDPTPEFKAAFGDVMEHGNEDYLDFEGGTVTGTGSLTGLNFQLVRAPESGEFVTQIGGGITSDIGANQVNSNFGLSGWMQISGVSVDLRTCTACTFDESFYTGLVGVQADVNVNLSPAAVPLPAAGFLLLGALAGVGGLARRRKG